MPRGRSFGENAIAEAPLSFEVASPYFDTKSWEDRFYTVRPKSVLTQTDGFYKITFDPPTGYPWGGSNLLIACIVEMRVGHPDDDEEDDVAMTEVAFANEGSHPVQDTEPLPPGICNCLATLSLVWPERATEEDIVYLVGNDFFAIDNGLPSGIARIDFQVAGTTRKYTLIPGEIGVELYMIGSRIIRCKLPNILDSDKGLFDVSVKFVGGDCGASPDGCAKKLDAIRIDAPSGGP
jgi:hypothetical protein